MAVLVRVPDAQALAVVELDLPGALDLQEKSSTGSALHAITGAVNALPRASILPRDQYGTRRRPSSRPRSRSPRVSGLTEPRSTTIRSSGTPKIGWLCTAVCVRLPSITGS